MTAAQSAPPAGADLSAFPEATLAAGVPMYRSHGTAHGAWYYDNGASGRFNLHGARGTCCTALSVDTAVREKVRGRVSRKGVVSRAVADSFVVSIVSAPTEHRCATVNDVDAAKHGIVRELTTMSDYSIPQAWAQAFEDAGFDGVLYGSAFTTGGPDAYALFGDAGEPSAHAGYTATRHLSGEDACRALGWTVANTPVTGGMAVI